MATALESLVVSLALDSDDYDGGLKRASGALDSFAGNATKVGGAMSLAVTTPIVALGGGALGMASDLSETTSKVNTLFGESATAITAWSENSAEAFGLSQQAALDSVGTLGNMFMQLGAESGNAATLSQSMVELSADIASFHNVAGGSQEVLDAMTSAFRGEYDALQRYIPTINAAAVEHHALAMTGKESASELTNLEKALAVQELVMTGAGAAVGDYARTADELANTQRSLTAALADVGAELGTVLLPVAADVAHAVAGLVKWFRDLSPEAKKWIVIFAGIAAAIGPVLVVLGTLASAVSAIMGLIGGAAGLGAILTALTGPIGLIVLAVGALAAAWATDFGGIRTKTEGFWRWITGEWPGWMDGLQRGWQGFSEWWQSDNETKLASVKTGWEGFWGWIDDKTGGGVTALEGYWTNYATSSETIATNNWESIKTAVTTGVEGIKGIVTAALQIMQGDWEGGLNTLKTTAETMMENVKGIFNLQLDNVRSLFTLFGWSELGEQVAQGIADGITAGLDWITDAAQAALDAAKWILGIHSPARVAMEEIGAPFSEGIGIGTTQEMDDVTSRLQGAITRMVDGLQMPSVDLAAAGGAGGMTFNVYLSGSATYDDGRQVAAGIDDELRARGRV